MVVKSIHDGNFPPSHPEWDNTKMVYVEDRNGAFLGKMNETPRNVFNAIKKGGASVVCTRDHTSDQCVMIYYR